MTTPISPNPLLTAEDADALAELSRKLRKGRAGRAVRDLTRLRPWMQAFAYRYALGPRMSTTEQRIEASRLASDQVSYAMVRYLKGREDFRALVEKYQTGGVEGAIAKYKNDLPYYVETHRKGLEMAVAGGDYKTIPKFTEHALQVVAPARNDLAQQNLQVNVTLSPKQLALEEAPEVEVTATPIAPTDPV